MHELRKLMSQKLFLFIYPVGIPGLYLLYLIKGQEGQEPEAHHHIRIIHVTPVLIEIIGRGLFGIEPHGALRGLTHLLAFIIQEKSLGHGEAVVTGLSPYELGASQHVAPLVITSELHVHPVMLMQIPEIIGLHYHVVKFKE